MSMTPGQLGETDAGVAAPEAPAEAGSGIKGRSPWEIFRHRLRRDKVTLVALFFAAFFCLVAALAGQLQSWGLIDPQTTHPDLVTDLGSLPTGFGGGISASHPLGVQPGTGIDLLSIIIAGMRTSLTVAVLATVISVVLGTTMGLIAGFAGGRVDWAISRFIELVLSFPQILMLLSLQAVLLVTVGRWIGQEPSAPTTKILFMVLVLGFFGFPFFARIIRGQVLSLREREFVEAARSLGARRFRIYVKELLPHLWAPLLVYTTLVMPQNISAEAALGFLGVGLNPPAWSLGSILNDSVFYSLPAPMYFIFPGLTVFLIVLAFNLLGDGLRDALDPKANR